MRSRCALRVAEYGFTLIELLVVIAIIAVLIGLLAQLLSAKYLMLLHDGVNRFVTRRHEHALRHHMFAIVDRQHIPCCL